MLLASIAVNWRHRADHRARRSRQRPAAPRSDHRWPSRSSSTWPCWATSSTPTSPSSSSTRSLLSSGPERRVDRGRCCPSASRSSPSTGSATSSTSTAATARRRDSPIDFALYIAFFPQLIAGPIVRYHEIATSSPSAHARPSECFAEGVVRFCQASARRSSSPTRWRRSPTPPSALRPAQLTRRRRLGRRARLHGPDLLRLLRLLRHGDRPRAHVRLPASRRTSTARTRRLLDHRLLAALAHHAVALVPRLPLHPARRQPRPSRADRTSTC